MNWTGRTINWTELNLTFIVVSLLYFKISLSLLFFFVLQCPLQKLKTSLFDSDFIIIKTHYSFILEIKNQNGSESICRYVITCTLRHCFKVWVFPIQGICWLFSTHTRAVHAPFVPFYRWRQITTTIIRPFAACNHLTRYISDTPLKNARDRGSIRK